MVKNELIERYIYAVTRHMSSSMKKDVANELLSIIQDMLEDRCGDLTPSDRDIRVVLAELGTPLELSQKYDSDSKNCLIGPPYYVTYKYVMKIVLICVTLGMLLAQCMAAVLSNKTWYEGMFDTITGVLDGLLFAFAFVTLLFTLFYKKGIKMENTDDSIDNLPPVPANKQKIKKSDPISSIVFNVIFTVIFLVCPQIVCLAWVKDGSMSAEPLFNLMYIKETWYFVILFAVLGIARDSMKLIEGSYTKRLLIVTVATNLIDMILSCIWLLNGSLLNDRFSSAVNHLFPENHELMNQFFGDFPKMFLAFILFALLLNTAETVIRTLKNTDFTENK